MRREDILALMEAVRSGEISATEATDTIERQSYGDIDYAKIDYDRERRKGYPEVIYAPGKSLEHLRGIVVDMAEKGVKNILITRASREVYEAIARSIPGAEYEETARIVIVNRSPLPMAAKPIAVITGGTADLPVAEEAAVTAEVMGNRVLRLYDVGVAGIHRLLSNRNLLFEAGVIVSVAGMDGALTSVVAGLVDVPVIGVPTSVGYGAGAGGVSALLTMLNSCSTGVGVVNIDNGFGAAALASTINKGGSKE